MAGCDICNHDVGWGPQESWTSRVRIRRSPAWLSPPVILMNIVYQLQGTYRISEAVVYQNSLTEDILKVPTDEDGILTFDLSRSHLTRDLFVFHDACWNIMQMYFHGISAPLGQLVEAFYLRPKPLPEIPDEGPFYLNGPRKHIDVREVVGSAKKRSRATCSVSQTPRSCKTVDAFAAFPPEIMHEVAQYLPTVDFYNLRLASRSMGQLFYEPIFWATRFEVDGERGFLSCLRRKARAGHPIMGDWQTIYSSTTSKNLSPRLWFRKKIWLRCQWVKDIITMSVQPNPSGMNPQSASDWDWREVQGHVRCDRDLALHPYPDYVNVVRTQSIYIPHDLTAVVISLIKEVDITYITGLRFLARNMAASVGYIAPGSPIIPMSGEFNGFVVAVDQKGIHALRVIAGEDISSWIGDPKYTSVTRRLVLQDPVKGLESCFDVS